MGTLWGSAGAQRNIYILRLRSVCRGDLVTTAEELERKLLAWIENGKRVREAKEALAR